MPGRNEHASSWKTIVELARTKTKGFPFIETAAQKKKNTFRMIYNIMESKYSFAKRERLGASGRASLIKGDISGQSIV